MHKLLKKSPVVCSKSYSITKINIYYQKAIYTGEMVLFEKSEDLKAESGERNEMRNKKALLDAFSNFALDSRRHF